MEQPSLLDATNRLLVIGAPIVVEGLRSIGCDIVATSGFLVQLPQLVVRYGPDLVLVHVDGAIAEVVPDVLQRVRERMRRLRIVVMLPTAARGLDLQSALDALDVEVLAHDCEPDLLRDVLGVLPSAPPVAVTVRELQVLQLAAEGLTNRAIGQRLGLRENTVKNYLRRVHEKFGVRSRTEAVMAAARAGYPVLPPH